MAKAKRRTVKPKKTTVVEKEVVRIGESKHFRVTTKTKKKAKKPTKSMKRVYSDLVDSYLQARYEVFTSLPKTTIDKKGVTNKKFEWQGESFTLRWQGLRDSSFYVLQQKFKELYGIDVPSRDKNDKDGYVHHKDSVTNWCKKKCKENGESSDLWVIYRELTMIRARKVIQTFGETEIICKPSEFPSLVKDTLFLLFCEKEDSGIAIQQELNERGIRCRMVLSEGVGKGVEFLLLMEIEKIKQSGENYHVVSIHDDDVGGGLIYQTLAKYTDNLIDGGMTKEFWKYHSKTYDFNNYAETQEFNENHPKYLKSKGYNSFSSETKKVELPVFILRESCKPVVDFIEYKIKCCAFNLKRIKISAVKQYYDNPDRLATCINEIDEFANTTYEKTTEEEETEKEIEELEEKKREELEALEEKYNDEVAEIESLHDPDIKTAEDELETLQNERQQLKDDLIAEWETETLDERDFEYWGKMFQIHKTFEKFHENYRDSLHLADIKAKKISQKAFLKRLVNKDFQNKRVFKALEEKTEEFIDNYQG